MGNDIKGSIQGSNNSNNYLNLKLIYNEIDKFYVTQLSKQQFTQQLFSQIDHMPHPQIGSLKVNQTYILQRFYTVMAQRNKFGVNCKQLKQLVDAIDKNPQKAIQKSFQLIDLQNDKYISDAEFLNYMDNILTSLIIALQKDNSENTFKVCLKEWLPKNKNVFYQQILKIFHKYKQSNPTKWNYADFKRWILSGQSWTMDITLGRKKYKTPVHLLALFGLPKSRN